MKEQLRLIALGATFAVALVAVGCGAAEEEAPAEAPAPAEEPAEEPMDVLADPTRPAAELEQDADRKALDVYEFLGVQDGMTVADVWASGGYNTHLLSRVNAGGQVYAILGFYAEGNFASKDALAQRIVDASLDNVEMVDGITDVPADSVDVSIAIRNFHDADDYGDGREATVQQLFAITKPGGIVGVVDVATPHEGWHEETHRLAEQAVIDNFTAGGFVLLESSDMLRNPDDDASTSGFEPEFGGRYKADRYLLKFQKPEASDS
ncbi:MAG: hypothetical protein GKS06_10810 [Acidobacteria bacterium]|nr:hypothetical protein [Acidobacteriota bacterium]